MPATRTVHNDGKVFWPEPGEGGVPEQAILIHRDNGGTCLQQEEQCIVISPEAILSLCKVLAGFAPRKKK